ALGVCANPRSLRRRRKHGRKKSSGCDAVDELKAVRDEVVNAEIFHQRLDGKIERAGDDDLTKSEAARLAYQLNRAGKDAGLQNVLEQFFGKETQTVFRLALVAAKEDVVEDHPAVRVGDGEHGDADERGGALAKRAHQPLLVA